MNQLRILISILIFGSIFQNLVLIL